MRAVRIYAVIVPVLIALDFFWLGNVMKDFYRANIGHLMSDTLLLVPGAVFYLLYAAGLLYFAILPGIKTGSLMRTVLMSACFGLIAYGTYDLTNQATLKAWPFIVTFADMAWGAFVSGVVSAIAFRFR